MPRSNGAHVGIRLVLLSALVLASPAVACPASSVQEADAAASAQSSSAAGPRPVWDWFANASFAGPRADQAAVVRAVNRQRLGHGSWICSPSGSGMLSSCFER
jgi:hypothetical protein